ncbi:MAG: hypothetical protein AAFX50_25020 [Acidobacteriota bacterium]
MTCYACGALYRAVATVDFEVEEIPLFPGDEHWSDGFTPAAGGPEVRAACLAGLWIFGSWQTGPRCEPPTACHSIRWAPAPRAARSKKLYDDAETWEQPHPGLFLARYRALLREAWSAWSEHGRTIDPVALRNETGELMAVTVPCAVGQLGKPSIFVTADGVAATAEDLERVRQAQRLEAGEAEGEVH